MNVKGEMKGKLAAFMPTVQIYCLYKYVLSNKGMWCWFFERLVH